MKKILFVGNVDGFHKAFHIDLFEALKNDGWTIDVASKGNNDFPFIETKYDFDIRRSPYSFKNIIAFKQLKNIINKNEYDIIHSHTPTGGVIARIANKNSKTINVYTAHGLHFYKGAPIINWILYYPAKKILSKKTQLLLTINQEDYKIAKKKFKNTKVEFINGVGINFNKFKREETATDIRKELGLRNDAYVVVSIGELNDKKNQMFAMKNFKKIIRENEKINYLIVGSGKNEKKYRKYIKKNKLNTNIKLLGSRDDVAAILSKSDLLISISKRDGQGINVIEAMRMKVVVLISEVRGHSYLIINEENGFMYKKNNHHDFIRKFNHILNCNSLEVIREKAFETSKKYNVNLINEGLLTIYNNLLEKGKINEI